MHRRHDVSGQLLIDDAQFATMIQGQFANDVDRMQHQKFPDMTSSMRGETVCI